MRDPIRYTPTGRKMFCPACGRENELGYYVTGGPGPKGNDFSVYKGVCECGARLGYVGHAGDEDRREYFVESVDMRVMRDLIGCWESCGGECHDDCDQEERKF